MFAKTLIALVMAAMPLQIALPEGSAGLWARTAADCADGPMVELTPEAAILRNGAQTRRLTGLDVCYSCFAGAQEESTVAMIQAGYEEPAMTNWAMFYYDSAARTLMSDFRDNADKALNQSFPLQDETLIRCPAA